MCNCDMQFELRHCMRQTTAEFLHYYVIMQIPSIFSIIYMQLC